MSAHIEIAIERLPHLSTDYPLPSYETEGSAGADLRAALGPDEVITLQPLERRLIPTGIKIALPEGFEAQVRPRSGLALKKGVTLVNAPGTVDTDYRGEIGVILINLGGEPFEIRAGDRIAQLVIASYVQARWRTVPSLDETTRGAGGFGSTGVAHSGGGT